MTPAETITVAAAQTAPRLGDVEGNFADIARFTRTAAEQGAQLVVFPECSLTGYRYDSREEAARDAETIPGPLTERLSALAAETGTHLAVGLVEESAGELFNAAVLVGPDGLVGKYHKTHLPYQAVDRFVSPGRIPFTVLDTPLGRIGMLICFDLRFPEPARVLTLAGVQIIVNLTALPPPGWPQPEFMFQTRAAENRVWLVCADRVGTERGVPFIGRSAIVSPSGKVLASAGDGEELLTGQVTPTEADEKDLLIDPGVYEMHLMGARRPDLYGPLTAAGTGVRPEPEAVSS